MSDIVERLRAAEGMRSYPVFNEDGESDGQAFTLLDNVDLCREAADEIAALRAYVRREIRSRLSGGPQRWLTEADVLSSIERVDGCDVADAVRRALNEGDDRPDRRAAGRGGGAATR